MNMDKYCDKTVAYVTLNGCRTIEMDWNTKAIALVLAAYERGVIRRLDLHHIAVNQATVIRLPEGSMAYKIVNINENVDIYKTLMDTIHELQPDEVYLVNVQYLAIDIDEVIERAHHR